MRRVLEFSVEEALPHAQQLLHRAGLPEDRDPPVRLRHLLDTALGLFVELAEPVGLLEEVAGGEFSDFYQGAGLNEPETALDRIYPRAEGLALFAATVGEPVSLRIRELFDALEAPLGFFLDAVASEAAVRLADLMAASFFGSLRAEGRGDGSTRVLPYSPGYCGWHVSGQRALFDRLVPERIGITLSSSCLMSPMKSVSGVLVAGPAELHRFRPDLPFCPACETRECLQRMRSAAHGPGAGLEAGSWTS